MNEQRLTHPNFPSALLQCHSAIILNFVKKNCSNKLFCIFYLSLFHKLSARDKYALNMYKGGISAKFVPLKYFNTYSVVRVGEFCHPELPGNAKIVYWSNLYSWSKKFPFHHLYFNGTISYKVHGRYTVNSRARSVIPGRSHRPSPGIHWAH